mgnify:CR=1 FL=1
MMVLQGDSLEIICGKSIHQDLLTSAQPGTHLTDVESTLFGYHQFTMIWQMPWHFSTFFRIQLRLHGRSD